MGDDSLAGYKFKVVNHQVDISQLMPLPKDRPVRVMVMHHKDITGKGGMVMPYTRTVYPISVYRQYARTGVRPLQELGPRHIITVTASRGCVWLFFKISDLEWKCRKD